MNRMEKRRSFTAIEWYRIKGRGKVATIANLPKDEYDPDNFRGQKVCIDGRLYRVHGVESFAVVRSKSTPYRGKFGLLVELDT